MSTVVYKSLRQWRVQTLRKRGGGGVVLLALLAFLPSVISSFFTPNKGWGTRAPPLDLSMLDHCYHFTNNTFLVSTLIGWLKFATSQINIQPNCFVKL